MIEHANIVHYVLGAREYVDIGPGSRWLQFAPFTFDASILEWSMCLAHGATLCFVEHPTWIVGEYLADVIARNGIEIMHVTPSVLATVPLDVPLPSLRCVLIGGEAATDGLFETWSKRTHVLNDYGPTETWYVSQQGPE